MPELTNAARDVLAERERQKLKLGWTEAHDDAHDEGELSRGAIAFISAANGACLMDGEGPVEMWKSHRPDQSPREKLVRAGALILAEIERIDRMAPTGDTPAEPEAEAPITDTERIDAIAATVGATTDGVVIHDATPDWSVVVMNDGEVCGRGEDVRGALNEMVRQDRLVKKVLAEHRSTPPREDR